MLVMKHMGKVDTGDESDIIEKSPVEDTVPLWDRYVEMCLT